MPEMHAVHTNFTSGEWSPRLYGRVDLKKYLNAASLIQNWRMFLQGGVTRRPGMHYVATVKTPAAGPIRMIPFQFSDQQAYVLELGNFYMRFYTNSGVLTSAGVPYEIVTPWAIADLPLLRPAQSADTIYFAHPSYSPQKMIRRGATDFLITPMLGLGGVLVDGPYLPIEQQMVPGQGPTLATLTPSATTGQINLTASFALFTSAMVGELWRIKVNTVWASVRFNTFTSSTVMGAAVVAVATSTPGAASALDGTTATSHWLRGAWSSDPALGYPRYVMFHEQRLWWLSNAAFPTAMWSSATGEFEVMSQNKSDGTTVLDIHAIIYNIASQKVNPLYWSMPSRDFLIGSLGAEFTMTGSSSSTVALTPTNASVKRQTSNGSANVAPISTDAAAVFVQRSGRKIREFAYVFQEDAYHAPDITALAEHLFPPHTGTTDGRVVFMQYQGLPEPTLWCVRGDGIMVGCLYDRSQDTVGWFQVITGPAPANGGTGKADVIEDVAVIAHENGDRDQVWVTVKRTINGAVTRFVEFLDDLNNPITAYGGSLNTDASLLYDGRIAQTLTLSQKTAGTGITATAGGGTPFSAGMVGHFIVIPNPDPANPDPGKFLITGFTSSTVLTGTIVTGEEFLSTTYAASTWGVTVTALAGLTYLSPSTVDVVADGGVLAPITLSGDTITLPVDACLVEVGLHYESTLITMRPEVTTQQGSSQGRKKRWTQIVVRLLNTLGLTISGPHKDTSDPVPFRAWNVDPFGVPPGIFSGDIKRTNLGWDSDGQMTFKQTQPLPCTITMLAGNLEVSEN